MFKEIRSEEEAIEMVKNLVTKESHIPIPTRLADIETHI